MMGGPRTQEVSVTTAAMSMCRRSRVVGPALALVLMLLAGACTDGEGDPTVAESPATSAGGASPSGAADPQQTAVPAPADGTTAPGPAPSQAPAPAPTPEEGTEVEYYLVRDHPSGVWVEPLLTKVQGEAVAAGALQAVLAGPTGDLTRPAPEGTLVNGVDIDPDGTATVDLSLPDGGGLGAAYEAALVQAIVHTVAQFDTVDRVRFLAGGSPVDTLFGHVDVSEPVEPDPFAVAPVVLTRVEEVAGSGVGGGSLELSGTANTFEATVELDLLDAQGNTIEQTFATASCGTGCRGEWSHAFTDLEPGTYTVVARAPDPSAGEGGPVFEVARQVTVPQP